MTKSLITMIAGIASLLLAISTIYGATSSFISIEGLIIVIGGSVVNAFLSYQRDDVLKAFITIKNLLQPQTFNRQKLHQDIMQFIRWAYVVQAQDFLGLEKSSARRNLDPLLRYGMDLVVTGYDATKVRDMMQTVSDAEFERRCAPVVVLRNMAAAAPAFGMVGTLIGMIMLLHHVGGDISGIGSGLAVAMLSTLYGLLAARLICLPAADKLLQQEENIRFRYYMLTEGLAMLSEKQNPFYMQDKLNSFLEPTKHFDLDSVQRNAFRRQFALAA